MYIRICHSATTGILDEGGIESVIDRLVVAGDRVSRVGNVVNVGLLLR